VEVADPQTVPPQAGDPALSPTDTQPAAWDRRKWFILAAICVAQFMVVLDIAVVNVALPSIRTDLHFTVESLQWVISAYAIFFGGFLLLGGRLADVIGRRRVFMAGLVIFAAASLACGFAWSEVSLITFRCIQGLGGALLSPAALSILVTTFAEGRERNLALGVWGGIAGSGAAAGTLLGGVLTSALGWQWIFYINVPIGAVLIGLSPLLLPAARESRERRGFDMPGAATATAGLMLLVYGLTRATQIGWSAAETITLLAVAAALLAGFIVIELRARHALLPLRILRLGTPRAANIVGFLIGAALFSQFFLLSLYMQQVLGYSALKTGVAYIATTFLTVVSAVVAQGLVNRIGTRVVLPIGLLLIMVAVLLYSRLPVNGSYVTNLLPGFLLAGVGLGLAFVPDSIAALTGATAPEAGAASGLINTSQQIGGAVGLAAITTIATTATTSYLRSHAALGALAPLSALTHGFQVGFLVLAGVLLVAAVLAAVLIGPARAAVESGVPAEPAVAGPARAARRRVPGRPQPVHVLGLVSAGEMGVARDSYDRLLFEAAREQAPEGMTIDEFDIAALPAFDGDGAFAEAEPASVAQLRAALRQSAAILVATPQYDSGVSGALRNAFAWAQRTDDGYRTVAAKPLAVMGPSCEEHDMREAQSRMEELLGAHPGAGDGAGDGDGAGRGTGGGTNLLVSCVRGAGPSSGGRTTDGAVRDSVRSLLMTLSEVAGPSGQPA
jgi:EmrB/QacA subfamily drug resistance transporter